MWEKLTLQERLQLLGIYAGSVGLAAWLAFSWGRLAGRQPMPTEISPAMGNSQVFELNPANPSGSEASPPSLAPAKDGVDASDTIVVHVAGRVKKPGVYTLQRGQRVQDAICQAGGALPDADLNQLNLAAHLEDAEKIEVPPKQKSPSPPTLSSPAESRPTGGGSKSRKVERGTLISLNRATAEELERLPGIGPVTVQKILDLRRERGRFESIEELLDVDGIGPKKLEKMRPFLRLD